MRQDDGRTVDGLLPQVSRSMFLKGAAGTVLGASALLAGAGTAAAVPTPVTSSRPGPTPAKAVKVGDLTGPDQTGRFGIAAADRAIPVTAPDGRLLFVFGDAWEQPRARSGRARGPVALWSDTADLNQGVIWSGAVGGATARQLLPSYHPNGSGVLPTDVLRIDNTLYLFVAVCDPHPRVSYTEIWRSTDSGATWVPTQTRFPGDRHGGRFQLATWADGGDGWVYVCSTGFQRDQPIILSRVPRGRITDQKAYQTWGYQHASWGWGNPPTPVMAGRFGELCLRPIGGKWVLTWVNAENNTIEGTVVDSPTSNLATAYRRTLIRGCAWGQESGDRVAQPYGGYLIPGSSLAELQLSVSQWNTQTGWPHRAMQYRVPFLSA